MEKIRNLELGAILTMTTGYNCTDDFDKVWDLVWFVCNDDMIGPMVIGAVKDDVKKHLLNIHPELKNVVYKKGMNLNKFISTQEEKLGKVLPVTQIGVKLPENVKAKKLKQ